VDLLPTVTRTHILADPTSFEEPLLDTTLSIIIDEYDQVVSVSQLGLGSAGSQDALLSCISAAKVRRKELAKLINF
jgi:exosome complex component RRP43